MNEYGQCGGTARAFIFDAGRGGSKIREIENKSGASVKVCTCVCMFTELTTHVNVL